MDLLDRDLSDVQLAVSHKRLDELHPADVADILEQLDPQQRANVFKHLDDAQATEAMSEMEDELSGRLHRGLGRRIALQACWATWTPTTLPTSFATFRTRKPKPFCA